jgi:hypothetical protein
MKIILINKLSLHLNCFENTIFKIVYFEYKTAKYLKLLYLLILENISLRLIEIYLVRIF